jgi:hypothetical protein
MRAIGRAKVFAQLVHAEVHQFDSILAVPRIVGAVRCLAGEGEFRTDRGVILETVARHGPRSDMQQECGIDVLEIAGTHEKRPADKLFLGGAKRDNDRSGNVEALHGLLHRECGGSGNTAMCVVAFHVAGSAGDERLALDRAERLRTLGQRIDFGDDGDYRLAGAPLCPKVGRHARAANFDRETAGFENVFQKLRALEFLHA